LPRLALKREGVPLPLLEEGTNGSECGHPIPLMQVVRLKTLKSVVWWAD
jgi:hypothetical protein